MLYATDYSSEGILSLSTSNAFFNFKNPHLIGEDILFCLVGNSRINKTRILMRVDRSDARIYLPESPGFNFALNEFMQISKQTIEELRQIIRGQYGRNLSTKETAEIANTLVSYFNLLAEIYHAEKLQDNYNEKL